MAVQPPVGFSERMVRANTIVLTTAVALLVVLSVVVMPLLAHLCEMTSRALDAPVPRLAPYLFRIPFWGACLIAALGTALLLAKEQIVHSTKWALWANLASCLAISVAGALVVVVLALPIHQLMKALGG